MESKQTQFPSVPQAAVLLLFGFLLRHLIDLALYDARGVLGLTGEQIMAMGMLLSNGILIALLAHFLGLGYRDIAHPAKASPAATFMLLVPPILLLLPLVLLLDGVLNAILAALLPLSAWEQQAFESMLAPTLASVVATCVLAPLFEEMLFRGILLRAFLARHPRGLAIGYSALYFGAAHMNVYQFFLAFFMGLLLGWIYERSRSLIPCIALHAAVNASMVAISAMDDPTSVLGLASATASTWAVAVAVAVAAAAAGAAALHYLLPRRADGRSADVA
ncbi:CPBP family intramembrane glutamic endopeptidase [Paracidovorax konjaci]|uniref:CAAX prenyl protease 2/Lysostaphin resistance protein A-like domain-containing protein n=1 Tax=Paracidovorax konjaci TaxID=32040 RepID=A0A1I1VDK1_9BURK|nr:CPBP family intramembrane glutamic endopeptidase [Paracidovorax konjaci]SFD80048.1 hypothetical protein SAMN04489710_106169 [Paracidovorax konjaci]